MEAWTKGVQVAHPSLFPGRKKVAGASDYRLASLLAQMREASRADKSILPIL
jgi:hypothetical protein